MKLYALFVCLLVLVLLPSCNGNRKAKMAKQPASSIIESCDIESIYQEQSLKEAAFSAIRRCIDTVQGVDEDHFIKSLEARCIDIPIPLSARPIAEYFMQTDAGAIGMAYESSLTLEAMQTFYQREMERSGWQELALHEGYEVLLVYVKPKKICVISLRPAFKRSQLVKMVISLVHTA